MKNQSQISKFSLMGSAAAVVLFAVLLLAFGSARGGVGAFLTGLAFVLLAAAIVGALVGFATYGESGRKAGSTPLIVGVIGMPVGAVLAALFAVAGPAVGMIGLLCLVVGAGCIIIGLVKRLAVRTADPVR